MPWEGDEERGQMLLLQDCRFATLLRFFFVQQVSILMQQYLRLQGQQYVLVFSDYIYLFIFVFNSLLEDSISSLKDLS